MRNASSRIYGAALILLLAASSFAQGHNHNELARLLKDRYKGQQVTVAVSGLYGGEFKKDAFGPRADGVQWHHFDGSVAIEGGNAIVDQIDGRTVAIRPPLFTDVGTNTFPIEKGEALGISDVQFACRGKMCNLFLYLTTMKLSKASALDHRKATRPTASSSIGLGRMGLGCAFIFHFDQSIGEEGPIIQAVQKYLLPPGEAEARLKAEKNIEIEIGASEEEVLKKLGEPVKSVRVGSQKTLRYRDLIVILKDGKVADIKID